MNLNKDTSHQEEIKKFINSLIELLQNNLFIIKWISSSYAWIEKHFLKNSIKKEKTKAILLNHKVNKPIEEKRRKATATEFSMARANSTNYADL